MAPVTDSPRSDDGDLALRWSGRVSLTPRILAVNIFALALLAGGFFYLDSYRSRIEDRSEEHTSELQSLMRISYAVFCLKKKKPKKQTNYTIPSTIPT